MDGQAPYQYHTGTIEQYRDEYEQYRDEYEQFLSYYLHPICEDIQQRMKQNNERYNHHEQTQEAEILMKTVTTEFNKIVLTEIFPLVPKAFQVLATELSDAQLKPQSNIEAEIMLEQASLLKEKISRYIDQQVDASMQIFKSEERCESND